MDKAEQERAACGYRRAGMTWRQVGSQLGCDKDSIRRRLTEQGLADGWGDSLIRPVDDEDYGPNIYGHVGKSTT